MKNPIKFIQEVKQEAFKVSWPTGKETLQGALMVFAMAVPTKLSDNVAAPSAPADDNKDAPLPSGGSKVEASGSPVKIKDGGEGNHGDSAKDHTPSDNIKVEPKKV